MTDTLLLLKGLMGDVSEEVAWQSLMPFLFSIYKNMQKKQKKQVGDITSP